MRRRLRIVGIFSRRKNGESEAGASKRGPIQVDQTSNIKVVARDALLIFFALTSIGGVVVVIADGDSANLMLARVAAVTSIVLFGIVGFCISGYLTPRRRWIHLLRVTACVWVLILAFFALIDLPTGERIGAWFLSAVYLLVVMGIGGAISFALTKDPGIPPCAQLLPSHPLVHHGRERLVAKA